jgi:predicted nuclease of predicted toxin-antitoxin system
MKLLLTKTSRRLVPFQHGLPGSSQVVLLGLGLDREVWQRPSGYVIVTRDADFQELSLVWGQPPKVVRLRTPNQTRAATLKVLLDHRELIVESLLTHGLASVEIIP